MNIGTAQTRNRLTAGILSAALLLAAMLSLPRTQKMPGLPTGPDMQAKQYSTVTIKTLDAANQALRDGAIRGIDVSQWQGSVDWSRVAQDNVSFVMLRASIGEQADTHFLANAPAAHNNGLLVGAYHYAKFTDRSSMVREANTFISMLRQATITYPVALDVEANRGLNRSTLTDLCLEFMQMVEAEGYTVMLYTYSNFIKQGNFEMNRFSSYDIWMANYVEQPDLDHKIWQHTSYGSVSGINGRVDINIAYTNMGAGASKGVVVDRDISISIKQTLNDRYSAGLPMEGLDVNTMYPAIVKGLQHEVNQQLDAGLLVDGVCDQQLLDLLSAISFEKNATSGNITYLIQAKLFYRGKYAQALNSTYDDYMEQALMAFQSDHDLSRTGVPDYSTLRLLFY